MTIDAGLIGASGIVPLFNHRDPDVAADAAGACIAGGATAIEITDRVAGAEHTVAAVAERVRREGSGVVVGAGSVVDPARVRELLDAGAMFVVSPGLSEAVALECRRAGVPYVPGCATASEVIRARELGASLTKMFPATELGGPPYLRSLRAAMPWLRAMPTGGVRNDPVELASYVHAGAECLGLGSDLIRRELLERRDWHSVTVAVRKAIDCVRAARES